MAVAPTVVQGKVIGNADPTYPPYPAYPAYPAPSASCPPAAPYAFSGAAPSQPAPTQHAHLEVLQASCRDASLPPEIRLSFIKKVYGILGVMLLITFGIGTPFIFATKATLSFFQANVWIVYIVGAILIAQVIFDLAMSCQLCCFICAQYTVQSVMLVFALTFVLILALTIYAVKTQADFTGRGAYIMVLILGLLMLLLVYSFFPGSVVLGKIVAGVGAMIFGFVIVYDTQQIFGSASASFGGGKRDLEYTLDIKAFAAWNFRFLETAFGAAFRHLLQEFQEEMASPLSFIFQQEAGTTSASFEVPSFSLRIWACTSSPSIMQWGCLFGYLQENWHTGSRSRNCEGSTRGGFGYRGAAVGFGLALASRVLRRAKAKAVKELPLPPGKPGNAFLDLIKYIKDPDAYIAEQVKLHGPIFQTNYFGRKTVIVGGAGERVY
eukprot:g19514.t1